MAKLEHKTRSSWLSSLFWISAAVMALTDWATGKHAGKVELTHPNVRFEPSDIHARGVVLVGGGVLLFLYLVIVGLHPLFEHFARVHAQESPPPLPITAHGLPIPPEPRLQAEPRRDLQQLRASEELELHRYAVINRQNGTVSIPIERAMDLLVERGIPPRKSPPANNLYFDPRAGSSRTGFEGKVEPEPR